MENASKALLMAAGILIGLLILALMVTLFASTKSLSDTYEGTKKSEAIQQFNVNFTRYLGQDLTIHQVVTMCNFAKKDSNKILEVTVSPASTYTIDRIQTDIDNIDDEDGMQKYRLIIEGYSNEGYINKIKFTEL